MTTYNGKPVFRPQGKAMRTPMDDFSALARQSVGQGGRVMKSEAGGFHIVSPSGAHWGSFDAPTSKFSAGTLQKFTPEDGVKDITDELFGR